MVLQYIIIGIVILLCLIYAGWRIHRAFKIKAGDPCYGCALKKVCRKDIDVHER